MHQKYIASCFPQISSIFTPSRLIEEGRTRRHDTWSAGCGGRDGVARGGIAGRSQASSWGCERLIRAGRAAQFAYGKSVWFWHPWLVSSWRRLFEPNRVRWAANPAATEAREIRLRGERAISRQPIAQGRPDALRWTCMLVCALLCAYCTRDRGCSAHPCFPCALSSLEGQAASTTRCVSRRENALAYPLPPPPDTISAPNHPELNPVATVSPCGIFRRLPRGGDRPDKTWKKKRQRRTI